MREMADVMAFYVVAGTVLALLATWVVVVLVRAPTAVDESLPPTGRTAKKSSSSLAETSDAAESGGGAAAPTEPDPNGAAAGSPQEPPKPDAIAESAALPATAHPASPPQEPKLVLADSTELPIAPVLVLPPMRSRLDSHQEIQDSPANATVIVMPEEAPAGAPRSPAVLVSAVGRSEPAADKSPERHAIASEHHLFVFADGSGRRVGKDLASELAIEAVIEAFEKNDASTFPDLPRLSARANRLRRAVLAANRLLLQRARVAGYAGLSTSVFAAHFSPNNEELFIAHVGANRAYRVRAGELTRLTTPHGIRFAGVSDKVDVEVVSAAAQANDLYLFCSDGLARALGETELSGILAADPSLERTTQSLIRAVQGKDNTENLVAMALRVEEG
jgi:PPM family protein phosphatase